MSNMEDYVEGLSDEDIYKELHKHGYPAGPVVDTTRSVYKNKLIQILEGTNADSPCQENYKPTGKPSSSFLSEEIKSSTRTFTSPTSEKSYSQSAYSSDDSPEIYASSTSPKLYSSSTKAYSSTPSPRPYGYTSKLDSEIDAIKERLEAQGPAYSQASTGYGSGVSSFQRRPFSDALQDTTLRHRPGAYYDYPSSRLSRSSQGKKNEKSYKQYLQIVAYVVVVVIISVVVYMIYNAWQETDPYKQVEKEAMKIAEQMKNVQNEHFDPI